MNGLDYQHHNRLMLRVWSIVIEGHAHADFTHSEIPAIINIMGRDQLRGRRADLVVGKMWRVYHTNINVPLLIIQANIVPEKPFLLRSLFAQYPNRLIPFYGRYHTPVLHKYLCDAYSNNIPLTKPDVHLLRYWTNLYFMILRDARSATPTTHGFELLSSTSTPSTPPSTEKNDDEWRDTVAFLCSDRLNPDLFIECVLFNCFL